MTRGELLQTIDALFGENQWPKPFHVLKAVYLVHEGATPAQAARIVGTTARAWRLLSTRKIPYGGFCKWV